MAHAARPRNRADGGMGRVPLPGCGRVGARETGAQAGVDQLGRRGAGDPRRGGREDGGRERCKEGRGTGGVVTEFIGVDHNYACNIILTSSAMPSSSSVGITHTCAVVLFGADRLVARADPAPVSIRARPEAFSFKSTSNSTPAQPIPSSTRLRTSPSCSPTPAENTIASTRPSSWKKYEARKCRIRDTNTSIASSASPSPCRAASWTSLKSFLPHSPSSPLWPFRIRSTSSADMRPLPTRNATMLGSTSPLRVAITSPAVGDRPMLVSMERPPLTAQMEAPAPRCIKIRLQSSTALPSCKATRFARYL
mmetsp:Transcript_2878/g.8580  ORF Transcript_2878/g.8580 Transcript_2878/m.8580 type:complete len:309 (-) Transcript_2878:563-1489(-)